MSAHGHSDDGTDFAHPMPLPLLFAVFLALVALTIVTVAQASFNLGSYDVLVVMLIATLKAALVAFFFMHLAFDKPLNTVIFLFGFIFVGLFVIVTLSDSRLTAESLEPVQEEVPAVVDQP